MGGSQRDGDHIDERANTEGHLQRHQVHHAQHALPGVLGQRGGNAARPRVGEEGEDGAEGGGGEDAVVELDQARVLEHVAPPQVGRVFLARVELVPELGPGRRQAQAHLGELVVDEPGVEPGDEGARQDGGEDKDGKGRNGAAEGGDGGALEGGGELQGGGRVGEQAACAQDAEADEEHPGVADEGGGEVGGEPVLGDAGVGAGGEQVVLEAGLDHPPADEALEADEGGDAGEVGGDGGGDAAAGDEVGGGGDEGQADEAAPQAVRPLHVVDLLELLDVHVRVQQPELRRRAVLVELGLPVRLRERRQGARHGLPLRYAEAVFTCDWSSARRNWEVGKMGEGREGSITQTRSTVSARRKPRSRRRWRRCR